MMLVSDAEKKAIDHYINDIPEEDEEIEEDIDYLLDLEYESFKEKELEYESNTDIE